jgi:hypothetical protein
MGDLKGKISIYALEICSVILTVIFVIFYLKYITY